MQRLFRLLLVAGLIVGVWALLRELLEQSSPAPRSGETPSKPSESARTGGGGSDVSGNGAAAISKAELYRQAQEHDVAGRSKMNKEQLAEAVAAARR